MKIKARLKDEYVGNEGLYPTNKKEEVKSKIDDDSEDITTSDTQYYLQFMKLFTMEMHLMIAI